jgi:drug/metabolite transporter (DMT)-like permease
MTWVGYSVLMFLGSVAYYLTLRRATLAKISQDLLLLTTFILPLVLYVIIGVTSGQSDPVSLPQLAAIAVIAVVFSYFGNLASLRAIELAPNPGYSLVLSKSYVLLTAAAAFVFLGAELSPLKILAIFLVIGFSSLIMINKGKAKAGGDNRWVWLSLAAFFSFGFMSLWSKYLFSHGLGTIPFLVYLYAIVTLCVLVVSKVRFSSFRGLSFFQWVLLIGVGVFAALFNIGQFQAIRLAPNVGYVNAVNAGSISLITVLAVLLFGDHLSARKAVGVAGVTAGLILLLI